ncbi:MAG: NAD(P)-dependent oxidoreductase [Chloroflexi bacterium]|nr:NAD(P)-dependent oxidoreductase [Chloroflexota bacterium]
MSGPNILITGGAGNLARVVAEELRGDHDVTLFDRVTPAQARTPWETDLPFVVGDLTNLGDCLRAVAMARAEAIIHLGALAGPTELVPSWRRRQQFLPEDETMRVNTMGTFYILDAARRLGVRQVLFASTFYVLGLGNRISDAPFVVEYLPIDEGHPLRPEDTYGLSKVLGEEILAAFNRAYDIQTIAFRLMGVTYPHVNVGWFSTNVVPEAKPGHVGGPIGTTFQYVDARDVARACRLALSAEGLDGFEAFYLATDTMLAEDTRVVVERLYPDLRAMAANLKGKEGMVSIEKARRKLGFEPQYSWRNMV